MAINPKLIRPLKLTGRAFGIARDSWQKVAFAGGVFAVIAAAITYFGGLSGDPATAQLVGSFGSLVMLLAGISASLVTSTVALGLKKAYMPSILIKDRAFWRYVWAGIACILIIGAIAGGIIMAGMASVPGDIFHRLSTAPNSVLTLTYLPAFVAVVLGVLAIVVLSVRLSLMVPAAAAGEKVSLTSSWRRTRGIFFRLLLATAVSSAPFYAALVLLNRAVDQFSDPVAVAAVGFMAVIVKLAKAAVEGALGGLVMVEILKVEAEATPDVAVEDSEILG